MKTLLTLSALTLAVVWIRRRRDHRRLVEAAGKACVWWNEEVPG